ncbi:MAG TPA: Spy/CpxP family protein refolding chaperone [Aliidongia sp.]|uniref:Spy/CpxP family protein refolding chaperone n=1 Tax=Aliidongia sp. TaxID=1914230 RepID=UPI002DDCD6F3|nr:Spy/CpxP family protein refolding chaperone [Aliidongia sp.]HEV2673074.1 Spy/CpxP family protein refolding chaperone [Aliidongia sp.]
MTSKTKTGGRSRKAAMAVCGLALLAGLGLAARAYAQQHPEGMAGHHGFGPGAHFARMCETMEARQAGMLAFAEVRLGITDAERPAWSKFAATVKGSSAPMKQVCASVVGQPEPKALPDHLHRMELIETARLEQLRQITPAVEELYGTLTAKQKEMADHFVDGMMHHGPGMGGSGMHGPGPGMHPPMHDGPAGTAPN